MFACICLFRTQSSLNLSSFPVSLFLFSSFFAPFFLLFLSPPCPICLAQRKADLTGEQEEIARLREEAKRLEAEQAEQRAKLRKEKESLEQSMKTQEDVEKEMQRIQTEKVKREEAEKYSNPSCRAPSPVDYASASVKICIAGLICKNV